MPFQYIHDHPFGGPQQFHDAPVGGNLRQERKKPAAARGASRFRKDAGVETRFIRSLMRRAVFRGAGGEQNRRGKDDDDQRNYEKGGRDVHGTGSLRLDEQIAGSD